MDNKYHNSSYRHEHNVHRNGAPMISTLIGQRTGCAEHFDDGHETKQEEDNPNDFVAFEEVFK